MAASKMFELKDGKVIMDFATFAELAKAKIESNKAQIEANNLKIEVAQYKAMIKELMGEIVKASDVDNNDFYKDNAMPFPLFPDVDNVCKNPDAKCVIKTIGGRNDAE